MILVPPARLGQGKLRLVASAAHVHQPERCISPQQNATLQRFAGCRVSHTHLTRCVAAGAVRGAVGRLQPELREHPVGVRQAGANLDATVEKVKTASGAQLPDANWGRCGVPAAFVVRLCSGATNTQSREGSSAFVASMQNGIGAVLTLSQTERHSMPRSYRPVERHRRTDGRRTHARCPADSGRCRTRGPVGC